jgi:hypothetical protein
MRRDDGSGDRLRRHGVYAVFVSQCGGSLQFRSMRDGRVQQWVWQL